MTLTRTLARTLLLVFLASSVQSALASPLSSLKQFLPDIAALDVRQDRDTLYVNVCNLWGVLSDSEKSLLIALQKPRGGLVSVVASTALFEPNGCHEFPVATVAELGISTSGGYNITAAALLQNGRADGNKYNNRITKRLDLVFPSKATAQDYIPYYYGNNNNANYYGDNTSYTNNPPYIENDSTRLCTAANNYCADSSGRYNQYGYTNKTMYCHNICPPGTQNCPRANNSVSISCDTNSYNAYQYSYNSYPYNNSSSVCTAANNFCRDPEFYGNDRNIPCTSTNNNCKDYYNVYTDNTNYNNQYNNYQYNNYPHDNYANTTYNRTPTRIIYPNGGETFANNSGNQFALNAYVNGNPSNVDHVVINIYRRSVNSGNYEELYRTDRSSPSYDNTYADHFTVARTFNTSDWTDGDYTARIIAYDKWNNVLTQDTTDGTFHVGVGNSGRSDLVVEKLYQNASDKRIVARICNRGSDMDRSASIRTDFSVNGRVASAYDTVQLFRDQCLDSMASVNPVDLYMDSNGAYSLSVRVDVDNAVEERDESNNTLSVSIHIEAFAEKPDIVIDRVSPDDSNRIINAHICNIGGDMLDSNVWTAEIVNTGTNASVRIAGNRLMKGKCMDIYGSYGNLGIYRSGGYSIRVSVDTNNAISEQSEYNNVMTQYLQTWIGN